MKKDRHKTERLRGQKRRWGGHYFWRNLLRRFDERRELAIDKLKEGEAVVVAKTDSTMIICGRG